MELTPLRYFVTIASLGHMTRAAEVLGVTQPALSAMLKKLEAEMGCPLLNRTGRGVELTDAGRVFLEHAEGAVRRADAGVQAVRELAGLERGSIRVGGGATAITYLLPPVFSEVRRRHPRLRFFVREAGSSAVAAAVLSGELDLGIVTVPVRLPGGGAGELMQTRLVEDELRLITPRGHRLSGRRRFRWKDLAGEPVVTFEAGSAVREIIDKASAAQGVSLEVAMELRSIESIKRMVGAGVGVGFVSRFAVGGGGAGGGGAGGGAERGLGCADGKLSRPLAVVRRRDRVPSAAAAVFERELASRARSFNKSS